MLALHKAFNIVVLVVIPIWTAMFHTETTFLLQTQQILHPDSKFSPQTPYSYFLAAAAVATLKYADTNKYLFYFFRHSCRRKYLIGICDEIHDLRRKKNCPVIVLYSLCDNTFKVLMWLNIYSDNAGTEQQKDTVKVVICICFVGIFYIRDCCLSVCNVQRMVVAIYYSKHDCYFGIQNTLLSIMWYVPNPLCGSTEQHSHRKHVILITLQGSPIF